MADALPRATRCWARAKLNGLDLELYLQHIFVRIADHPIQRLYEFLPRNVIGSRPIDRS